MRKVLVALLCLGLLGCAGGFARYRGGTYESAIPIYQGEPPEQFPYANVGFVTGEYKGQLLETPGTKITRALQNMANNARSMGANAVIKVNLRSSMNTVYYQGEAVYFNRMPNE